MRAPGQKRCAIYQRNTGTAGKTLNEREEQLSNYARGFAEYLAAQTGVEISMPENQDADHLRGSIERLELALEQLADLASVYGEDSRHDVEPLVMPTAVLAGEYLRVGAGARWLEPAFDGDTALLLAMPDGVALDMHGLAHSTLVSPHQHLTTVVNRLLNPESWSGDAR